MQHLAIGTAVLRPGLCSNFTCGDSGVSRRRVLLASRIPAAASRYSAGAGRRDSRSSGDEGRFKRISKRRPSADDSYFAPEDSEASESEYSEEDYSDNGEEEGEQTRRDSRLELTERKARPKLIVKNYLENLRARILHGDAPEPKPTRAFSDDQFSEESDYSEVEQERETAARSTARGTESETTTRSNGGGTGEKISARSFLEKLKARRSEKKLVENEDEAPRGERGAERRSRKKAVFEEDEEEDYDRVTTRSVESKVKFIGRGYDSPDEYSAQRSRRQSYRGSRDDKEIKREDAFYSTRSFRRLGASLEVIEALESMDIQRPSEIQALAFKEVVSGNTCIVADQTGSGKTLAYLAPLVQRLRKQEEDGKFSTPKNPRALVLVPTSELAMQVLSVCRALSRKCPLKSMVATGGFKWKTQVENLENAPDIVVATPGRFLHHLEQETMQLDKLQSVVLDEVDILFEEEEFIQAMEKVNEQASWDLQYIHVTATLPTDVHDKILNLHPDSIPIMGPSLHLTAPGLNEVLVDCSGGDDDKKTPESAFENKKAALLKLVQESTAEKTIVFCNKIETCRKVENILNRYDRTGKKLSVLPYHAALKQEARLQSIRDFLTQRRETPTFLVCTDRASRGLDPVGVDRVILFDFPRDPSEYIRRVGRTARAGGVGKVFVFVVGKQVSLAKKVMDRNEKRHPVHAVPGLDSVS